ncbi:hypothetical protein MATL_G00151420 [Megalops atlanticus]|uniref:Chromo domain-containing protein n=1 Tax=Megalops atlanticus TaxID=7932 RepID=A0A9D3PWN5_MEGAT|nr:hypothetical protein MATL_G00151420 [Megalops atlanticus]
MDEGAAGTARAEPGDSEQDEEEDVYEVEKIIDMRVEEGEVLYRVRWKYYTSDDDTWEPEANLEDCKEVVLAFRRKLADSKASREAAVVEEAQEVSAGPVQECQLAVTPRGIVGTREEEEQMDLTARLPVKSDLFDTVCDGDERDASSPKRNKKKESMEHSKDFSPEMHRKENKKETKWKEERVSPAPQSDRTEMEDEASEPAPVPPPPSSQTTSMPKRACESEDDEEPFVSPKKHKKDKPKDVEKARREKPKGGEKPRKEKLKDGGKQKKGGGEKKRKGRWNTLDSSEEDEWAAAGAPTEKTAVRAAAKPHRAQREEAATSKAKPRQGGAGLKLQGIRDLIQERKGGKSPAPQKESTHQRLKNLISGKSHSKAPRSSTEDDTTLLSSDSSDVVVVSKRKNKGKEQEAVAQRALSSPSSSSAAVGPKEDEAKQDVGSASGLGAKGKNASCSWSVKQGDSVEKDHSTGNLFEKFLLNREAKDKVSRRQSGNKAVPENRVEQAKTTAPKTAGKAEKKPKPSKESVAQNPEPNRTEKAKRDSKTPEASWLAQSPTSLEAGEKQERRERSDSQAVRRQKSESLAERWEKADSLAERRENMDNQMKQEKPEEVLASRVTGDPMENLGETQERKEKAEHQREKGEGQGERRERPEETCGGQQKGAKPAEAASPELAEDTLAAGRMRERRRRREDSEPRLYIACDDNQDSQDTSGPPDKPDRGPSSPSFGVELELDWMSMEDFQKHLNGDDEIFSAATLTADELRDVVKSGDYLAVKFALNSKEDYNLEQEHSSGMSLAMLAAAGGQDDILRLLIKKGAKVNSRQKNGMTALMHAAEKNFLSTVAILLEAGAYINMQTLSGETALMRACKRGNAEVVRLLLEHGADCNILSKYQNNALHFAKLSNNVIVYDYVKDHVNMLSSVAEETIRAYFETRLALLEPVFPLACHRLCEGPDFSLEFNYKPPQHSPVEGTGILLFIFHANFLSEVTARLCGPCSVHAVVLNDKFQLPIFLDSHFIYSFSPVQGTNKLFIRLAESPTAKVKLLICAYRVQLQ